MQLYQKKGDTVNSIILAAVLIWPATCDQIGALYHDAARVRQQVPQLQDALRLTTDIRIQRMLTHVYLRPDMTPEQWRWFAIGACVGQEGAKPTGRRV